MSLRAGLPFLLVTAATACGAPSTTPLTASTPDASALPSASAARSAARPGPFGALPEASLATRVGHAYPKCSTLSADGARLYVGGDDTEIRVVELATEKSVTWTVRGCPLSPANRIVYVRGAGALNAVDAASGAVRWTHTLDDAPAVITDSALLLHATREGKVPIVRETGMSFLADPMKSVWRSAASRDGALGFLTLGDLSTGSDLRLVDLATGVEKRRWSIGKTSHELESSADGARLATAFDRSVTLWDTTTGKELRDIGYFDEPNAMRFSDDGRQIAIGDFRGVTVRETDTGKSVLDVPSGFGIPEELRFTGSGQIVALYGNGPRWVRRWQIDTQTEAPHPHPNLGDVLTAAWVDDERVIVAVQNYAVHLVGLKDARVTSTWQLSRALYKGESIDQLVVRGTQCLASTGYHLFTLDLAGKDLTAGDPSRLGYTALLSSDGAWQVTDPDQGISSRVSLTHDGVEQTIPLSVALATDVEAGNVALITDDDEIRVWSATSGALTAVDQSNDQTRVVALSPDGKALFLGGSDALVVGVADNRVLWKLSETAPSKEGRQIDEVAFSKDGKKVAIGIGEDVLVVDAASGAPIAGWHAHLARSVALAFSPDQRRLLSASADGTLAVWDLP